MQTTGLGNTGESISRLIYGCMRLVGDGSGDDRRQGKVAVRAAVAAGYTAFDHADIYGNGECERLFGEILAETPGLREKLFLIGKCGIRFAGHPGQEDPQRYDFSREHLLNSVDGSLSRLGVEHLDLLLLHRPDYLADPDEVAAVFEALAAGGKVRYFGVSNFRPSQVELLASATDIPLVANQVEINLHRIAAFEDGTLDQCRRRRILPQAWSPLAGAVFEAWGNTFDESDRARIDAELTRQAERYDTSLANVVLAWLLRHPAGIAPVIGSTTPARIEDAVAALDIEYSREDWYRLFEARNGHEVA